MFNVSSETTATLPAGANPPRTAKSNSAPQADQFGALVDDSLPAESSSGDVRPTPAQAASQRRADATAPNKDISRASYSDNGPPKAASTDADVSAASSSPRNDNADMNSTVGNRSKAKTAKATSAVSNDTGTAIASPADDAAAPGQPDAQAGVPLVAAAIATFIPAPVVPATVHASPAADSKAPAPLAIAAAAIAASAVASTPRTPPEIAGKLNLSTTPIKDAAAAFASGDQTTEDSMAGANAGNSLAVSMPAAPASPAAVKNTNATADALVLATGDQTGTPATPAQTPAVSADVAVALPLVKGTAIAKTASVVPGLQKSAGDDADGTGAAASSATPPTSNASHDKVAAQNPAADATKSGEPKAEAGFAPTDGKPALSATPLREHLPASDQAQGANAASDPTSLVQTAALQPQSAASATLPTTNLTATVANPVAVPLNGLALQIAVTAKSGKSSFEIRLDPAELGRIDVRVDVDRNGQVTSHLTVEKPETLSMLRQDAPQLQRALDDAGLKTGSGGLQFSLRDQSSSGQNGSNGDAGRNMQRLVISEEDSAPAALAGRSYGRMLGSSGGIDIRV